MAPCPMARLRGPGLPRNPDRWENVGARNHPTMETVPESSPPREEKYLDENAEQFQPGPSAIRVSEPAEFRSALVRIAREQGFVRVGVTSAEPFLDAGHRFERWLGRGYAGSMTYLSELGPRHEPGRLLANARSVVVAAAAVPRGDAERTGECGQVADYALGLDYHIALRSRLRRIGQALADLSGQAVWTRPCIDTAPLLEREAARRAGLGFIAKSTMLIVPGVGPRVLLACLVTDLPLWEDPPERDRCGRCTACLDACPTQAFVAPYELDARRCLSYLNIEHQGELPREFRTALGSRLIGCDVCQSVCPYDRKESAEVMPSDFSPRPLLSRPALVQWLGMSSSDYRRITKRTALRRVARIQLMRNAAVALGNSGSSAAVSPLIHALKNAKGVVVRSHAAWALGKVGGVEARAALEAALTSESEAQVRTEILLALGRNAPLRHSAAEQFCSTKAATPKSAPQ